MSPELDKKLVKKYPKIFADRYGDMCTTCMCWGFECGDGWYWLIDALCSNLQWNTDNNNKDYVIENKLLRRLIPFLWRNCQKLPGKYNLNRKKQINPLVIIRSFLLGLIHDWRKSLKFIYIESNRYPQITAVQVKEKFGGLRFYVHSASDSQHAIINWAESLSYRICENCGSSKNIGSTQGWLRTLCIECRDPNSNWKLNTEENGGEDTETT
jgi:hypothetical protein